MGHRPMAVATGRSHAVCCRGAGRHSTGPLSAPSRGVSGRSGVAGRAAESGGPLASGEAIYGSPMGRSSTSAMAWPGAHPCGPRGGAPGVPAPHPGAVVASGRTSGLEPGEPPHRRDGHHGTMEPRPSRPGLGSRGTMARALSHPDAMHARPLCAGGRVRGRRRPSVAMAIRDYRGGQTVKATRILNS